MGGGDERAALLGRLHHGDAQAEAADDAVAPGEAVAGGAGPRRVFAHQSAQPGHGLLQLPVPGGIDHVHPRAQHGDHRTPGPESPLGGGAVDTLRQTGDDDAALLRQLPGNALRRRLSVFGGFSGAHHADAQPIVHRRQLTFNIDDRGRILDAPQPVGIIRILEAEDLHAGLPALLLDGLGAGDIFSFQGPKIPFPQALHAPQGGGIGQEQLPRRAHGPKTAAHDPGADPQPGQPEPIAQIRHSFLSPDRPPT